MTDARDKTSIGRRDLMKGAGLTGVAALASPVAKAETMPKTLTADEVRELLKLEPNQTCGFVRVTYRARSRSPRAACPRRSPTGAR
jgi:hypothetical protein